MNKTTLLPCLLIVASTFVAIPVLSQKTKTPKKESTASEAISIPFTAEKWEFEPGKVQFTEYRGLRVARLNGESGDIIFKELSFKNGTIEFDVEVNQPSPFPTIYFRWQNKNESEHVYLRTGVASKRNAFDAVQYASIVNGVNLWDLQHEFQSAAHIKINDWNHIKLVVSGKQLRVYINNPTEPNLEIPYLEGDTHEGKIGIGTGFPGEAVFANLTVTPHATEGLPEMAAPDLTKHDTRYIRGWQISKPDSLPIGRELHVSLLPNENTTWESITAERRGLVNISRKLGNSASRRYVWLLVNIKSEVDQKINLKLGFSDEVWVFVNRQPVYLDKNIYYLNMLKSPNGRISLDNSQCDLPLKKGENQLLIGVANDFYGWGIIARLENIEGIEF
jgi:hypothetical protein